MIRLLVAGTLLALITYWLHRRLVRAPGLTGKSAFVADLALVVLLVVALAASVTGTVLDPAWHAHWDSSATAGSPPGST